MPRAISAAAMTAILAETTDRVFLTTLRVSSAEMSTLYFVNNLLPITVGGQVYEAFPFEIMLPTDDQDKLPVARIRISNVSREIVDSIRGMISTPSFVIAVRLASTPDTIEYGPWTMDGTAVSYDENFVEVDLRIRDFSVEPFPYMRMTPSRFPGLFR